jgi:hypothetical protein
VFPSCGALPEMFFKITPTVICIFIKNKKYAYTEKYFQISPLNYFLFLPLKPNVWLRPCFQWYYQNSTAILENSLNVLISQLAGVFL